MSKKYSNTTADYLLWSDAMNLVRKLYDDNKTVMSLYVACSCFFGMRASDTLSLKWEDLHDKKEFELIERKTKKRRAIKINQQLHYHIENCYNRIKPLTLNEPIFKSQKDTIYSIQRINVLLKNMKQEYNLKIKNFSSHSLRKAFGRAIFERSGENAELAIIKLSQLFNHSSASITRKYLGISQQELLETYEILSF
jgi:integrase